MKLITKNLTIAMLGACSASAASIAWDPVVVNTTAADIITNGALHVASNSADADDATINGVVFTAQSGGPLASNADGNFFTGFGGDSGDAGFNLLLDSHSYIGGGGSFDITGLTSGNAYEIQIIAVGDARGCCLDRNQQFGGGGSISGDLRRGDPSSVIGSFVADGDTQTIDVLVGSGNSSDPGVSGFQVRDLGAVPEPSSALLSLVGLIGLAARRRR